MSGMEGGIMAAIIPPGTDKPGGAVYRIVGLAHHRHQQRRDSCGISNRRTGQACHDHRCQHAHVTQTAWPVAYQFHWQVDDTLRQAARVHELTRQYKEGDG